MTINLTKKQIIIGAVLIIGIIYLIIFYKPSATPVSNSNTVSTSTMTTSTATSNTPVKTTTTTSGAKTVVTSKTVQNQVLIYKASFSPTALNITKGAVVTWVNKDTSIHRIVADNIGPTSADLLPGQAYSYKFTVAGVFGYHDYANSTTTGTIIVK